MAPAACAALLGVLAVVVLVHASGQARLLRGSTLAAVSVLGVLLVVVVATGFTWAGRLARSAGGPVAEFGHMAGPAAPVAPMAAAASASASGATTAADKGVFVHLSHRLQSLVHRQIQLLDELENDVEEPDLLKGLFGVDHLATRMRRHAENLAVLGGAVPRRQWTKPVSVMEVLRSAVSETLDYARVQVIARAPGSLNGYAVADVVHLLAELVENATSFSPPDTKVVLRTQAVAAGLAIEIDDRGLGMSQQEYDRLNALLKEPTQISVQELLEGARIGLYVVAQLARRHGIAVHLQTNITGGTQALVVLPKAVLAAEPRSLVAATPPQAPAPAPAPSAAPQPVPAAVARTSASVSEPGERRDLAQRTSTAGRLSELGDAAPAARPVYGVDGVLPAPRRPMNGTAVGAPVERPPVRNPAPASGSASAAPAPGSSDSTGTRSSDADLRRPLPRRRPQEHIAAPLAQGSSDPADRAGDVLMPNLLADFKRGMDLGANEPGSGGHPHEHARNQEGNR